MLNFKQNNLSVSRDSQSKLQPVGLYEKIRLLDASELRRSVISLTSVLIIHQLIIHQLLIPRSSQPNKTKQAQTSN
jgi:hypothetical protein